MNGKKSASLAQYAEETAIKATAVTAILAAIFFVIFNYGYKSLPILGVHSIGLPIIVFGFIFTLILFSFSYYLSTNFDQSSVIKKKGSLKRVVNTVTLSMVHAFLLAVFSAILVVLLNYAFKGLELDIYSSTFMVICYSAVLAYIVVNLAMNISPESLAILVVTFMLVGVGLSMITTDTTDWWEVNFSYLGTNVSGTYRLFNLTLFFGSLTLLALSDYLFDGVKEIVEKNKKVKMNRFVLAQQIFIAGSLATGGVGLFSYTRAPTLHNYSAMLAGAFFGALMFGIYWLIPIFNRSFYLISAALGLSLVIFWVVLLNGIGYLSLTAFELIAAGFCGAWVGLFMRNIGLLKQTAQTQKAS